MVAGRPRTVSLEPEEMIALGEEMIAYVKKHYKTMLHLSQWYSIEKMFTEKQWETFCDRAEFVPYYEQALHLIGFKYLDKNSNVRDSISHRWQRVYFKDLKRSEDSDSDAEYARKAKALNHELQVSEEAKQGILAKIQANKRTLES